MARISGIDLQNKKRLDIALTSIYGIGRNNVKKLLDTAQVQGSLRVEKITEEQLNRIQKTLDKGFKTEGNLRTEIIENIKRLKEQWEL